MSRQRSLPLAFLVASSATALVVPVVPAQDAQPGEAATTVAGPRNAPLYDGAQALQAGYTAEGVRLTLEGLKLAQGKREEETALANLCTGYLRLRQFTAALEYCDLLIERNEGAWRAYNTRAMVYLELQQYEKADEDLKRAEAINPDAQTLRVARALYNDAVHPVAPQVEIDDRDRSELDTNAR